MPRMMRALVTEPVIRRPAKQMETGPKPGVKIRKRQEMRPERMRKARTRMVQTRMPEAKMRKARMPGTIPMRMVQKRMRQKTITEMAPAWIATCQMPVMRTRGRSQAQVLEQGIPSQ